MASPRNRSTLVTTQSNRHPSPYDTFLIENGPGLGGEPGYAGLTVDRVVLSGEEVIGWCNISPPRREGFTHCGRLGIGVRWGFRKLGIGTRLVDRTIRKAKEKGLERIELKVFGPNIPAIKLHEKVGFVVEGVRKKARKLDGACDDLVEMALFVR